MEEDELQGLVPFFVSTTLGTTGCCAFDALEEIGQALQKFQNVWLHVDAAYAGNAFICPELKPLMKVNLRFKRQETRLYPICIHRASTTPTLSTPTQINGFSQISIVRRSGYVTESV